MSFHINIFSALLLMSGVATLLLAFLILYSSDAMVKWFAAIMFCSAIWGIAYSFELASTTLNQMLFWINIEYIGISFLPATWIIFMIKFIGKHQWLSMQNRVTIMVFPIMTLLLVWTNAWHNIHYEAIQVDTSGPFPLLAIKPGPWYHVHTVYFYFMLALGIGLLIYKFRNANIAFKRQSRALFIGASLPWLVNFLYLIGIRPFHHIDLTPYAFMVTSVSIAYALFRYRLFKVIPMAREKVLEAIREGILVVDAQESVVDMNPAMKTFLPSYLTEIIGEPFCDILPEHTELHQLVRKKTSSRAELQINGRYYEVAVTQLFDKKLQKGTILIFWDSTERVIANREIQQQTEQLRELNHLKDRLFSIVAHDLRSPIANLTALLSLAENSQATGEEFKAMLTTLSRNVGYTSAMLENILYWAIGQLEGYSVTPQEFDLKAMMHDKILLMEKRASDKGIVLYNRVPNGIMLHADPDMIGIVLRNLLSNAVKFCRANDKITITTQVKIDSVIVCVADTGMGMENTKVNKLFTSGGITTRGTGNEKGTGLGLKLCKEFVERNNGRFWLNSTPGIGSEFYFEVKGMTRECPGA